MQVACGVAVREGKVLICKRGASGAYPGYWEFPFVPLEDGEVLEEALERGVFERLSSKVSAAVRLFSLDSRCVEGVRIHAYGVRLSEKHMVLEGYDAANWIGVNKLSRFRLLPDCVTLVNEMQKKM